MNKKRYLILIALVIFVFLAVFTFANPLNKAEDENRVLEEIEEEDVIEKEEVEKDEEKEIIEIKPVVVPEYNNHGVTIDKEEKDEVKEEVEEIVEDKSYELALKAVEKAEITLSNTDFEKAFDLALKVSDEDKQVELLDRVSAVLEIIDLTDVVNTLVDNVNSAESKADMNSARNYAVTNDIAKRLNNLSNEVVKGLLTDKLETIDTLLDDTKDPIINIEDGAILDSETKIIVTDDNEVIIILNDEEIDNNEVVGAGEYTLTVTDAAFNTKTIKFTIDTTAPEFVVKETSVGNGEYYSMLDMQVVDTNLSYVTINGTKFGATTPYDIDSVNYVIGENTVVAKDAAGNETTMTFTLVEDVIVLDDTYTFTANQELEIVTGETYVLDLNDNTYEIEERLNARPIENYGTLIIKNGKMLNESTGYQYGIINNFGTLIIENVEFIDNGNGFGSTIRNRGGEIIIKNSNFETTGATNDGNAAIISEGKLTIENTNIKSASNRVYPLQVVGGEATINGVTVDGTHGALGITAGTVVVEDLKYTAQKYYGIYITNNGEANAEEINVTINSGTFEGQYYGLYAGIGDYGYENVNATITINGGTFKGGNGSIAIAKNIKTYNWDVTINGGTFIGNISKGTPSSTGTFDFKITSGNFTSSVASDLVSEYEESLNAETGYYEVTKKDA